MAGRWQKWGYLFLVIVRYMHDNTVSLLIGSFYRGRQTLMTKVKKALKGKRITNVTDGTAANSVAKVHELKGLKVHTER